MVKELLIIIIASFTTVSRTAVISMLEWKRAVLTYNNPQFWRVVNQKLADELNKNEIWVTQLEAYSRVAGEGEARNVQNRYSMTAEERLNTLLADTEVVAREDQIILANGLISLSAKKEQFRNTDDSTVMTFEEAKKLYPNIVDLSEAFNTPAPDAEVIKKYLNDLYKNEPYATLTPDKKNDFINPRIN